MCLHLCGHRAISLTGNFYNGPVLSRRPCGDRAVIVLSPQPCIEIARCPCGFGTDIVRWLCDPRVFSKRVQLLILLEIALQTCKKDSS